MRAGIVPLATEVGQFKNILGQKTLCRLWGLGEVESESHFLLYWTNYGDLRNGSTKTQK